VIGRRESQLGRWATIIAQSAAPGHQRVPTCFFAGRLVEPRAGRLPLAIHVVACFEGGAKRRVPPSPGHEPQGVGLVVAGDVSYGRDPLFGFGPLEMRLLQPLSEQALSISPFRAC